MTKEPITKKKKMTKVETLVNKRTTMKFWMINVNFKWMREKIRKKRPSMICHCIKNTTCHITRKETSRCFQCYWEAVIQMLGDIIRVSRKSCVLHTLANFGFQIIFCIYQNIKLLPINLIITKKTMIKI